MVSDSAGSSASGPVDGPVSPDPSSSPWIRSGASATSAGVHHVAAPDPSKAFHSGAGTANAARTVPFGGMVASEGSTHPQSLSFTNAVGHWTRP